MSVVRLTLFLALFAIAWPASAEWFRYEDSKMGTRVEVQFWLDEPGDEEALRTTAMDEFDRIEVLMSTYIESSEISRVNRDAADKAQVVSKELFALVDVALQLSELTEGAFDITYDSVGNLYDFRESKRPDALAIAEHIDAVDYRNVSLDEGQLSIAFGKPGVRINLGGIAKGYSCEQVISLLYERGVRHALVSAGGDTRILGDRRDKPWIVGVQDPDRKEAIFTRLALEDEAVSTSGDYERFFFKDGVRYHHILTPSTGKPVEGVRSVTIIGPDATMTDGLSTSVFVMGPEAGTALIDSLEGYEMLIIMADGKYYFSGGLTDS